MCLCDPQGKYVPKSGLVCKGVHKQIMLLFNLLGVNLKFVPKLLFVGARVVFWDLRDSFLFPLYRGNVENARLDCVLPHIDTVSYISI